MIMCKFIEVSDMTGNKRLVNTDYIVEVMKYEDCATLVMSKTCGVETNFNVRLPYESVRKILCPDE